MSTKSSKEDFSTLSYDARMEIELERALADSSRESSTSGNCDVNKNTEDRQGGGAKSKPQPQPRRSPPHTYENDEFVQRYLDNRRSKSCEKEVISDGSLTSRSVSDSRLDTSTGAREILGGEFSGNVKAKVKSLSNLMSDTDDVKLQKNTASPVHTYVNDEIAAKLQQGRTPGNSAGGDNAAPDDSCLYDDTVVQSEHKDESNLYDDTEVIRKGSSGVEGADGSQQGSQSDGGRVADTTLQRVPSVDEEAEYDDIDVPPSPSGCGTISEGHVTPDDTVYDDAFVPDDDTDNTEEKPQLRPKPVPRQQPKIQRTSSEMDERYDDIDLPDDETTLQNQDSTKSSSGGYDHLWKSTLKGNGSEGDYGTVSSPGDVTDNATAVLDEPVYFDYDVSPLKTEAPTPGDARCQSSEEEPIYEPIGGDKKTSDSDDSWGSDEFEEYDDEDTTREERKPLAENVQNTGFLVRLGNTFRASKRKQSPEEDTIYRDVDLNSAKHPPPALPPMPDGLTPKQIKRRLIISSIVSSEQSYLESVTRLVKEYEQPLTDNPSMLTKDKIRTMFFKLRDIRQVHLQFQIALKEMIDAWDKNEEIADVFIASFGKTIVFDVYSDFVNNFSQAMEMVKLVSRQKQAFADFIKQKMNNSADKLSIFGLMVKPVQRFPQYILQLQDLLKHTPEDHKDRLKLQMALTELENLAHKLNENKRESERKYAIRTILNNLKLSHKCEEHGISRTLIRQDNMSQVEYNSHGEQVKSKHRRMIILSDLLICATVMHRESSVDVPGGTSEKYTVKWRVPLQDVEYVETAVTSNVQINVMGAPGRTTLMSKEVPQEEPIHLHQEVTNMLHDRAVLAEICALASSLKLAHKNFSAELVEGLLKDLQKTIYTKNEQLKMLESSTIQIIIPANEPKRSRQHDQGTLGRAAKKYEINRSGTVRYFFRTTKPALKRDWVLDFQAAKLALDLKNRPAWVFPESTGSSTSSLAEVPLFFKPLPIDVTRLYTKISCGLPLYVQSSSGSDLELQHLWVCSSLPDRGQVTILSMCSNKPHLLQSFQASDEAITCAELVPGVAGCSSTDGFEEDTVWMGTVGKSIVVHALPSQDSQDSTTRPVPKLIVSLPSIPVRLKFACNRLIVAMENGTVAIYSRAKDGGWKVKESRLLSLGNQPVTCLLPIGDEMFASCGTIVHVISLMKSSEYKVTSRPLDIAAPITDMVKAGVGLWVALQDKPTLKLYHLETFESLQVMDIDRAVARAVASKEKTINAADMTKKVSITCLLVTRGLLWIGTNIGIILTIPLPRLEGVPRIHSSPTVACHAHNGPVKFLLPICCGLGVPHIIDRPTPARPQFDDVGSPGADSKSQRFAMSLETDKNRTVPSEDLVRTRSRRSASLDDVPNEVEEMSHFYDDPVSLTLPKAVSTPNLLDQDYGGEYINLLYGSLMRKHNEVEFESSLNDKGDYMSVMATKGDVTNYRKSMTMSRAKGVLRSLRTKSVPVINEKDEIDEAAYETYAKQHMGLVDTHRRSMIDVNTSSGSIAKSGTHDVKGSRESMGFDEGSKVLYRHGPLCRSVTVVTGGEGYCNWNKVKAKDLKNTESCLLLWQCTYPTALSSV